MGNFVNYVNAVNMVNQTPPIRSTASAMFTAFTNSQVYFIKIILRIEEVLAVLNPTFIIQHQKVIKSKSSKVFPHPDQGWSGYNGYPC